MEKDSRELLDEVIRKTLEDISELEEGSEKKADAIDNLKELYRLKIDDDKNNWEYNDRAEKRAEELNAQKKDRRVRIGLELTSIFAPLLGYASLFARGLKFEETGAITSSMVRNLLSKVKIGRK